MRSIFLLRCHHYTFAFNSISFPTNRSDFLRRMAGQRKGLCKTVARALHTWERGWEHGDQQLTYFLFLPPTPAQALQHV